MLINNYIKKEGRALRPDRHLSKKIPASMSKAGILVSRDYSISSLRPVGSSFFCFGSVRVRTPSL